MPSESFVQQLAVTQEFFERSTRCLVEDDSGFQATGELFTVSQQVAHVAQTIDWFMEGAFRPEGFDMDFEAMHGQVVEIVSLGAAREWLSTSFSKAKELIASKSMEELSELMPADCIMGPSPRFSIISAIADHTAHHRGALTVYSRMIGHTPAMPYMDMPE